MPRRQVVFEPGEFYHVYNRGVAREQVYMTAANYAFFLQRLREQVVAETDVIAYCLMPNHFHLLVRVRADGLSQAMQRLGTSYTKAINRQEDRVGPLFQGRFQAVHVDREDYLLHLSRYVHRNPLEAGLVASAAEWPFSSYPDYVGEREGTLPTMEPILNAFESRDAYRRFVEYDAIVTPEGFASVELDHG